MGQDSSGMRVLHFPFKQSGAKRKVLYDCAWGRSDWPFTFVHFLINFLDWCDDLMLFVNLTWFRITMETPLSMFLMRLFPEIRRLTLIVGGTISQTVRKQTKHQHSFPCFLTEWNVTSSLVCLLLWLPRYGELYPRLWPKQSFPCSLKLFLWGILL